jgi:hypothetical protein
MLVIYTISKFSQSIKAKLQKRDRKGRFARPLPKAADIKRNPLVSFFYPMSSRPCDSLMRTVRLISSTETHFTGLEKQADGKWKYKKFLQPKATAFRVIQFNPKSMS